MPTSLTAIASKAQRSRTHRFQNLYHLLNPRNLRTCFEELDKNAAPGVDRVNWVDYQKNLDANINQLARELKDEKYRARPVRRKYIAKTNGKMRPLGIPCQSDKIAQRAVAKILEAVYEQDFLDFSYGYRPGRSPQQATQELSQVQQFGPYGWVVEADIRGFFDAVDHDWLMRMLGKRQNNPIL